ncbi:hypothetical protein F5883DRAFT_554173 [Diaporthe sp. PMI_573]|nr:hypothetical protein F5883DRAFT_554173 [Diaporthaceae sp. PMI_573]
MSPIFCTNVNEPFLLDDGSNQGSFRYPHFDATEQHLFGSHIGDSLSFGFSGEMEPTFMSLSGAIDEQLGPILPFRSASDPTTKNPPACSEEQGSSPIQNEDSMTRGIRASPDWRETYESPNRQGGVLSPTADFCEQTMATHVDEGIGLKTTTSPLPNWVWPQTSESTDGTDRNGLGNTSLSELQRLPVEPRNDMCGCHCPICKQQFKRRDNVKPHVRRKHPEIYDGLYSMSNTKPTQSIAAPAHLPSTRDEFTPSWTSELRIPTPDFLQPDVAFSRSGVATQKRSLDSAFPGDQDILDGSDSRCSPRFKDSHYDQTRSFACPFSKSNPFQYRKCLGLTLQRPKDVKQHIYRYHTKPDYYCASCYKVFQTATDRDGHSRKRVCESLDGPMLPKFQGITEEQKKLLNKKLPRDSNVEKQWYQIYDILFPGADRPISPYVGNCLEDVVPLLRHRWNTQGHKIMERAPDGVSHDQLRCAIDLFLDSLEGETLEYDTDDSSICAFPA